MNKLKLASVVFLSAVICVIAVLIFGTPKPEIKTPDSELVKCIEKKMLSGEIHMDTSALAFFWPYSDEWIDDSTIVIEVKRDELEFSSVSGEFEYLNFATLHISGKNIELSKHESDRIVEITDKQKKKLEKIAEAKQKIAKAKQKKEQDNLRAKFIKNCK